MTKVIECIANFSEGRNAATVGEIARAIASSGSDVLDVSSDADHHRTVITFSGDENTIAEGTVRGIQKAAELIDLTGHRGQHPRIGATDVVPFVPLRHATMEDCVKVAHAVGERVGNELGLPVYLYEFAATRQNVATWRTFGAGNMKHSARRSPKINGNPITDPLQWERRGQ
jgi:glutamate formiminotransferase